MLVSRQAEDRLLKLIRDNLKAVGCQCGQQFVVISAVNFDHVHDRGLIRQSARPFAEGKGVLSSPNARRSVFQRNFLSTGAMDCDRAYVDDINEVLRAGLDDPMPQGGYIYVTNWRESH